MAGAAKPCRSNYSQGGRSLTLDRCTHRAKETTELGDMRFHCRMPDLGDTACSNGCENSRLRPGDRRLVEVEGRSRQSIRRVQDVARLVADDGTERNQRT
jgi:hypothetical protein